MTRPPTTSTFRPARGACVRFVTGGDELVGRTALAVFADPEEPETRTVVSLDDSTAVFPVPNVALAPGTDRPCMSQDPRCCLLLPCGPCATLHSHAVVRALLAADLDEKQIETFLDVRARELRTFKEQALAMLGQARQARQGLSTPRGDAGASNGGGMVPPPPPVSPPVVEVAEGPDSRGGGPVGTGSSASSATDETDRPTLEVLVPSVRPSAAEAGDAPEEPRAVVAQALETGSSSSPTVEVAAVVEHEEKTTATKNGAAKGRVRGRKRVPSEANGADAGKGSASGDVTPSDPGLEEEKQGAGGGSPGREEEVP